MDQLDLKQPITLTADPKKKKSSHKHYLQLFGRGLSPTNCPRDHNHIYVERKTKASFRGKKQHPGARQSGSIDSSGYGPRMDQIFVRSNKCPIGTGTNSQVVDVCEEI